MHKFSTRFLFATIGIGVCGFSTWATAQSESTANLRCPAGYWQMQSLCLSDATGDVVNAEPAAAPRVTLKPGCAPGYWRLDSLCLSPETGDVELVDEKRWRAGPRADAAQNQVAAVHPAALVDTDALTAESDFTVFMHKDVAEEVRLAALRRLWVLLQLPVSCDELCYEPHPGA